MLVYPRREFLHWQTTVVSGTDNAKRVLWGTPEKNVSSSRKISGNAIGKPSDLEKSIDLYQEVHSFFMGSPSVLLVNLKIM